MVSTLKKLEWRSWWYQLGPRVTVVAVIIVALLSMITGIANIGSQTIAGPLASVIPKSVQRTVGFTGALTGFLILTSAIGLRRGLRVAWYVTVLLLPVTAFQGVLQSSPLSIPLIIFSIAALPNVVAHRRRFQRSVSLSTTQLAAIAAILGALVYGTIGTYALRAEFTNVSTLTDAVYYTLVTASTVGYGDAAPTSQIARLFGMSVIVVGTASFAIALGTILGPAIEARFSRVLGRSNQVELELLEDHILVLGGDDWSEIAIETLRSEDIEHVVITKRSQWATKWDDKQTTVLVGDPSDEATLTRARLSTARGVIIATHNDAEDAIAVLTVRQLQPDITIAAAAVNEQNIDKLKQAGADSVISPSVIGGRLIVQSALGSQQPTEKQTLEISDSADLSDISDEF